MGPIGGHHVIHRAIIDAMPTDGSVPPLSWGAIEARSPDAGQLHAALIPHPGDAPPPDLETLGPMTRPEDVRMGGAASVLDTMTLVVTGPPRSGIVCMAMADRIADAICRMEGTLIPATAGERDFLSPPDGDALPPHIAAVVRTYGLHHTGRIRIHAVTRGRPGYDETRATRAVSCMLPISVLWEATAVRP